MLTYFLSLRERDPILGIVTLDLAKLLSESSEKTGLYAIQDGIGFGCVTLMLMPFPANNFRYSRASVSVLFKSVNLELPRPLLGWDTATVEIFPQPITLTLTKAQSNKFKKLVLSTVDGEQKFDKPSSENTWTPTDMIRLPVYTRFASALVIELHDTGFDLVHRGADAIALLWLKDIEEHIEQEIELPVWSGDSDKLATLKENVVTDSYRSRHGKNFEQIGSLKVKLRVDPGLDFVSGSCELFCRCLISRYRSTSRRPNLTLVAVLSRASEYKRKFCHIVKLTLSSVHRRARRMSLKDSLRRASTSCATASAVCVPTRVYERSTGWRKASRTKSSQTSHPSANVSPSPRSPV